MKFSTVYLSIHLPSVWRPNGTANPKKAVRAALGSIICWIEVCASSFQKSPIMKSEENCFARGTRSVWHVSSLCGNAWNTLLLSKSRC